MGDRDPRTLGTTGTSLPPTAQSGLLQRNDGNSTPGVAGRHPNHKALGKRAPKNAASIAGQTTGGVSGAIAGVGDDIIAYVREVGVSFHCAIYVTSGKRDADGQAHAMFDNWAKMDYGNNYSKAAVPTANLKLLNAEYKIAKESPDATEKEKEAAKAKFLEICKTVKSKHVLGRAVDIRLSTVTKVAHAALLLKMQEVPEGSKKKKRTDIFHIESVDTVPAVDDALRTRWEQLYSKSAPGAHATIRPATGDPKVCHDHVC